MVTIDAVTFREHISYLSVMVMNQRDVYVKLRTWLFLATFSFHYSINDLRSASSLEIVCVEIDMKFSRPFLFYLV